jgi:hypothetical protein
VIDQNKTVDENKGRDINLGYIIKSQMAINEIFEHYPNIEFGIEKIYEF